MAEACIAESFSEPPPDWLAMARAESLYLDTPYLRYASRDHGRVFRAEARATGSLAAGVTGWVAEGAGHPYLDPRALLKLPPAREPDLVLGNPGAFSGDMLLDSALAGATTAIALQAALVDNARGADVMALYADGCAADFWQEATGRPPALVSFDTVIEVPGSFDEWLARRPRQRRSTIRRELRHFEEAGLTGGIAHAGEDTLPGLIAELAPILVSSEARFGNAMNAEAVAATLERQRLALGDAFAMFHVRDRAGRLVAGATAFLDARTVHMRWGGVDRVHAGDHLEYFHVACYQPIRFAARSGRTHVRLGMESFEAKLLRGAELEPRFAIAISDVEGWASASASTTAAAMAKLDALLERFPAAMGREARAGLAARLSRV